VPPEVIGDALADAYNALHDEGLSLFPEAHETLDAKKVGRRHGLKLQSRRVIAEGHWDAVGIRYNTSIH
jgi:hypothetical protein